MKIITIDFETFWDSKEYTLSKMGPLSYIRDPRFHAQMVGIRIDRGPVRVFTGDDIAPVLHAMKLHEPDRMVVGHNLNGFDALILSEVYGIRPACMVDTMSMGRWIGIIRDVGGSHAALTEYLENGTKRAGTVISDGKKWPDGFTPEERADFIQYCSEDVLQCSENFYKMLPYVTKDMLYFTSLTAKMGTEAMLELDVDALHAHLKALDDATEQARDEVSKIFSFPDRESFLRGVRSAGSFCTMLRALGVEPPTKLSEKKTAANKAKLEEQAAAGDLEAQDLLGRGRHEVFVPALSKTDLDFIALREHEDPRVQLLVNTRLEQNSSIQRSRTERLLALAGKPMPVMLSAFKADTSRYTAGTDSAASDGLNTQNLSKRDPNQLALRKAIKAPAGYKVVAADSSQIEARMLAYIAGQDDLVQTFRDKRDPYSEMAFNFNVGMTADEIKRGAKEGNKTAKVYRNVGKTAVLSCFTGETLVLTSAGWKQIAKLDGTELLFDGSYYVRYEGVVSQGMKPVILMDGIGVTPDHIFYHGNRKYTAEKLRTDNKRRGECQKYTSTRIKKYGGEIRPSVAPAPYIYPDGQAIVYDLINVGPRRRFIVKGLNGAYVVSNCGYGVGWKKFADTLLRQGTKLYDDIENHYTMAQWCHTVYRQSVPQIVGLWKRCQGIIELLVAGQSGQFGGPNDDLFTFGMEPMMPGKSPVPTVTMPSGFKLRYPELRVQMNEKGTPEYVYTRIRGKNKTAQRIYGASFVENCTQGIAFQLLMWQACRMQEAGIQLKGNVHDSWYTIVPESQAEKTSELMQYWMSQVPPWLPDFPVACEAEIGDDFTVA